MFHRDFENNLIRRIATAALSVKAEQLWVWLSVSVNWLFNVLLLL
jgi:hypothetical protein